MKNGTLYYRVVAQDRGRGYMLLIAWGKPVVQRNCEQITTLSVLTEASLARTLESVKTLYSAGLMVDVTDSNVAGQLKRLFASQAEPVDPTAE